MWGQLYGPMSGQDAPWLMRQVLKFQFARMGTGASIDIAAAVKAGLGLDFKGFSRALEQRKELVKELQRRFDDYDFIISPVATGPALGTTRNMRRSTSTGGRSHTSIMRCRSWRCTTRVGTRRW